MNNQGAGRFEGQVGRVRYSPYPFKDTTLASGREINRDQEVLKSMIFLSEQLGKRSELDAIEANTIEDFMTKCDVVLGNSEFFNACIGSREWENKDGYINNDLYLPRINKGLVPVEGLNKESSKLIQFNASEHVKAVVKKESNTEAATANFEGQSGSGSDFEL